MKAFGHLLGSSHTGFGVAVSGGSDSTALLVLAAEFRAQTGTPFSAVTVDHGLRPEAKDEAKSVADLCRRLDVVHHVLTWSPDAARQVGQEAARRARHVLLAQWAERQGVRRIALGHMRDDRLETFLIRMRQGSGWHGLAGLMPDSYSPAWPEGRGVMLVRPLMAFGRNELREELRARGIGWIEDPSNQSDRFERVRVRRLLAHLQPVTHTKMLSAADHLLRLRCAVVAEARAIVPTAEDGDASVGVPFSSSPALLIAFAT